MKATLITSELPSKIIQDFADRLNKIENVDLNVLPIKNNFFGGGINIAGLITATDIKEQTKRFETRETVFVPNICLRDDSLFLDDYTVESLAEETGLDIRVTGNKPRELVTALGILPPERTRNRFGSSRWVTEG